MVRTVIKHRHKVAIATDEHDAVYGSTIDQAHHIHTEIQVQVCLLRTTGKCFVMLGGDAISQSLHRLQEHLLRSWLRTGRTVSLRSDQAAVATQEVKQLAKVNCQVQR